MPHADPQAFSGVQVDNRQQAQSSPVKQRTRDKIHAPDVIRIQTLRLRLPALGRFIAAWPFEAQRQTLLKVEAVDSFMIIAPAFPPERHVYPAVPVMAPGSGYLTDA